MIEILVVWALARKIGSIVKEKGHSSAGYIILTIALWIGGEIAGAIVGSVLAAVLEWSQCLVYLFALAGAACGGGIAYWIANSLPQRMPVPAPVPEASSLEAAQATPALEPTDEP